jgi:hypothetical protein
MLVWMVDITLKWWGKNLYIQSGGERTGLNRLF